MCLQRACNGTPISGRRQKRTEHSVFATALHSNARSELAGWGAAAQPDERSDVHSPTACRATRVLDTALHDAARREAALEGAVASSRTAVIPEARRDQRSRHQRRGQKLLPKHGWYLNCAKRAFQSPDRYAPGSPDAQRWS